MLIAHISDTHIVRGDKKAYGIADTAKNLTNCIEYINKLEPKVDIALVTGDVTNGGEYKGLAYAKTILDKLNCPYYVIPGNHDTRKGIWQVFKGKACPEKHKEFINYVIDDYEIRFIALDSTIPNKPGAEICSIRARWLDKQLSKNLDKPTIIFMHHPPVKCNILETNKDGFIGADLLGDIVKKYANIKAILCGHIHLQAHVNWKNTIVSVAPSTEMRLKLDLSMEKESQFYLDLPAFQLHYWTSDKNLISYPLAVHNQEKAYSFKEQ